MKKRNTTRVSYRVNPIPPPPKQDSLLCNMVYLFASFINNTESLDIYSEDKNRRFRMVYRGCGRKHKRYLKKGDY